MFKLKFGILWTTITTAVFALFVFVPANVRNGDEVSLMPVLILGLFEVVGIILLVSGAKQVIKDKKTSKYGLQCYGIVRQILQTGSYVNNRPEYKAVIDFVNPESQQVQSIEEIIGFDYNKYPVNYYVMCKYYEGDINLEYPVDESQAPEDVKKVLAIAQPEELTYSAYSADQPEPQPQQVYANQVSEEPVTAEEAAQAQQAYVAQAEQQQQAYASQFEQSQQPVVQQPQVDPLQQLVYTAPVPQPALEPAPVQEVAPQEVPQNI